MKTVGIIILNYKKWRDTIECLNSFNGDHDNRIFFIVDNFSNNNSLEHINDWWSRKYGEPIGKYNDFVKSNDKKTFFSIQLFENLGYAVGNNIGIKLAVKLGCEYVLILNPDTLVTDGFTEPMVRFLSENSDVGMVGPKILKSNKTVDYVCARKRPTIFDYFIPTYIWRYFFKNGLNLNPYNPVLYPPKSYLGTVPKKVDIISGACMLIKSETITKISFLDEGTFLYLEELILHEKLKRVKLQTYFIPESVIIHKQGSSTSLNSWLFLRKEYLKSLHFYLEKYRRYNFLIVNFIVLNVLTFQIFSLIKLYIKKIFEK